MSRNRSQRQQNPGLEDPLDQILIHNGLAQLIPHGPRGRTGAQGDRREGGPGHQSQQADVLDATVIASGLAELIPCQRRGRPPLVFGLALLLLVIVSFFGIPLGGVLLCLVLAVAIEAVNYARRQHISWPRALARPSFWDRIRPSFYWPLAVGSGLFALFAVGETLLLSLLRVGFQWLCFRAIEGLVRHPERTRSVRAFADWVARFGHHVDHAWSVWLGSVILTITVAFAVNLAAPGVWAAVGNSGWDRLLLTSGGFYLIALLAFLRSSRSMAHSALQEGMESWEEPKVGDLGGALGLVHTGQGVRHTGPGIAQQIEGMLAWKQVDSLVARVGPKLAHSLTQRLRWSAFLASLSAFALAFVFLAASVFLIVPRDVIAGWVSPGGTGAQEIVLAFDSLEELASLGYAERILALDWSSLGQEPIPKVAYLEAAILTALVLLRAATDRSMLRRMAGADATNVHRWLLLGTAYLLLLEEGFQYVYSGRVSRQVTGDGTLRIKTLPNEVLLAPSVATKASVYRAISNFHHLYGASERRGPTSLVTVFASRRLAYDWARTFLQFPSLAGEQVMDVARVAPPEPDAASRKYWLWSGGQMVDLASLEEAQWYGRFAAHRI
jgi:hypothetical protein